MVDKRLLEMCAGSDLEKQRLAEKVSSSVKQVVIDNKGIEMEAKEWKQVNKKILQK